MRRGGPFQPHRAEVGMPVCRLTLTVRFERHSELRFVSGCMVLRGGAKTLDLAMLLMEQQKAKCFWFAHVIQLHQHSQPINITI